MLELLTSCRPSQQLEAGPEAVGALGAGATALPSHQAPPACHTPPAECARGWRLAGRGGVWPPGRGQGFGVGGGGAEGSERQSWMRRDCRRRGGVGGGGAVGFWTGGEASERRRDCWWRGGWGCPRTMFSPAINDLAPKISSGNQQKTQKSSIA